MLTSSFIRRVWLVSTCALTSCAVDTELSSEARVACDADHDCPDGFACSELRGTCFRSGINYPPILLLDPVPRGITQVRIPYRVFDTNVVSGNDRLEVEFQYTLSAAGAFAPDDEWSKANTCGDGDNVQRDIRFVGLEPADAGAFLWDALTDATGGGSGGGGLAAAAATAVYADDGGITEEQVVATHANVVVRARAKDSAGASSGWRVTEPFLLGNDAPTVTEFLASTTTPRRGEIALQATVSDPAADPANLFVEFSTDGATWLPAEISMGATSQVPTSAEGVRHVFVWNSAAPAADPATPQGIGATTVGSVTIRVTASDATTAASWLPTAGLGTYLPPNFDLNCGAVAEAMDGESTFRSAPVEVALGSVSNL